MLRQQRTNSVMRLADLCPLPALPYACIFDAAGMLTYIRLPMHPILLLAYIAGFVAFAVFYSREEGTRRARIVAVVGVILAILLSLLNVVIGGAILVAATFYVADRKNRSRAWAIPAMFFGPIVLLIVVYLPKLPNEGTLSLNS